MGNTIGWFEIPATDYDRAVEFYSTVIDREIDEMENDESEGRYGLFRTNESDVGGAIAQMDEYAPDESEAAISYTPSADSGTVIYLSVEGDLNDALSNVEPAGGEVLVTKQETGEGSYYAFVVDTEGNRVGLMSEE